MHSISPIDFKQNRTVGSDSMLTFQMCTQILQVNPQPHNRKQMLIIPSFLEWWHIALTPLFPLHWSLLFHMAAPYRRVCWVQNIYLHKCKSFTEPSSFWAQSAPGLPLSQSFWRGNNQICCFRRNFLYPWQLRGSDTVAVGLQISFLRFQQTPHTQTLAMSMPLQNVYLKFHTDQTLSSWFLRLLTKKVWLESIHLSLALLSSHLSLVRNTLTIKAIHFK